MIYNKGCDKLTTEFNMKSSGTVVYTTKLQAKCVKMRWHMGTQAAGSTINIIHQYRQIDTAMLQEHWSPVPSKGKAKQHDDEQVHHEDAHTSSQSQALTFLRRLRD